MNKHAYVLPLVLFVGLLIAACVPIQRPPTSTAEGFADIFALNQRLGRGVNFGNALEAPNEGEWGMRLEESYFSQIAEAGFDSVRVPIRWSAHADTSAPFTIDEPFFERIDWVIAQAKANDLAAVLNMHHYEEIFVDPSAHSERFVAIWRQIAERYKDEPPTILFELLNEPHDALSEKRWNELLAETIATVRQSNPTRAIVVGPGQWNSINALNTLELPDDPNLIVTYHYYEPFTFTHQGAEWVDGSNAWMGTTWPENSSQKATIAYHFGNAAKWAADHNRPLYMGEFGAYSKADQESRQLWTAAVVKAAQKYNISMSYWEFGAGFGVYDRTRGEWNQWLLNALLN